jgi:hypothetical protein
MQIDPLNDPVRQFACMNIAADAGVAPPVRYANAEQALSIIDFIETVPLSEHFPRLRDFHRQMSTGELSAASYEGKLLYGKVLLNEALYNMKTPRFAEAISKMS